jgi:hypothetical protein
MRLKTPKWESAAPGVKILRLYQTKLNPTWPRILILELTADKFSEFEHDPLEFDKKYKLFYPESPISWISTCAKPPHVKDVPPASDSACWTVVILKGGMTKGACAAFPHESS